MINEEFQPGFSGTLGTGAGQHAASKRDRIDHKLINKLELAIQQLNSIYSGNGFYGPVRFETSDGYIEETFDGDGTTTDFTLVRSIPKEIISGYDIFAVNPYGSGVLPATSSGSLTGFSTSTNMTNTVSFTTAPPVGTDNVIIRYRNLTQWGSALNSSAYLASAEITGL